SFMRRTEPEALLPRPRPTVVEAPLVQVIVTEPEVSRGEEALVTIGSYAPKATAPVEIVQTFATLAETPTLAVADPAEAGEAARASAARVPRATFFIVTPCFRDRVSPVPRWSCVPFSLGKKSLRGCDRFSRCLSQGREARDMPRRVSGHRAGA